MIPKCGNCMRKNASTCPFSWSLTSQYSGSVPLYYDVSDQQEVDVFTFDCETSRLKICLCSCLWILSMLSNLIDADNILWCPRNCVHSDKTFFPPPTQLLGNPVLDLILGYLRDNHSIGTAPSLCYVHPKHTTTVSMVVLGSVSMVKSSQCKLQGFSADKAKSLHLQHTFHEEPLLRNIGQGLNNLGEWLRKSCCSLVRHWQTYATFLIQ